MTSLQTECVQRLCELPGATNARQDISRLGKQHLIRPLQIANSNLQKSIRSHTMNFTRNSLFVITIVCALVAQSASAQQSNEQDLLKILNSDASNAEKAVACKRLAIFGTETSVPELEKLLPDSQLSSWARTAIEAIPGEASNKALRNAAKTLNGRPQLGAVNSLGVRRDTKSIELLADLLKSDSESLASAAAFSLGKIGGETPASILQDALGKSQGKVRSAVAHAAILCAEQLNRMGDSAMAVDLYEAVRNADVPKQRVVEATRGTILASDERAGLDLLVETLKSNDKTMFQLALCTIREFPGSNLDPVLVEQLAVLPASRSALLITAMADREQTVDVKAILDAAKSGEKLIQLSAIRSLQKIGNESCLDVLLEMAIDSQDEIASAAQSTLANVPGQGVDRQIVERLKKAEGEILPVLIRLVGQRRIAAVREVAKGLQHSDQGVRLASLFALGETVNQDELTILISQLAKSGSAANKKAIETALTTASVRMPNADKCTEVLVSAMKSKPNIANSLLETIGAVGGKSALDALSTAAKSDDPDRQDIASRLLGKWNNATAAPVLLDLAKNAPAQKFQIRALRGYIGIARKFPMPEEQRVRMCRNAINAAQRSQEAVLVLDVLKVRPSQFGLDLANELKKVPELREKATAAAETISKKIGR